MLLDDASGAVLADASGAVADASRSGGAYGARDAAGGSKGGVRRPCCIDRPQERVTESGEGHSVAITIADELGVPPPPDKFPAVGAHERAAPVARIVLPAALVPIARRAHQHAAWHRVRETTRTDADRG